MGATVFRQLFWQLLSLAWLGLQTTVQAAPALGTDFWQWLFGQSAFAVLAYILIQMLNQARDRELQNIKDYAKALETEHARSTDVLMANERSNNQVIARMEAVETEVEGARGELSALSDKIDAVLRWLERGRRGSAARDTGN